MNQAERLRPTRPGPKMEEAPGELHGVVVLRQVGIFLAASREICNSVRRMEPGRWYWVTDWVKRVCGV